MRRAAVFASMVFAGLLLGALAAYLTAPRSGEPLPRGSGCRRRAA